jgi:putative pyruvate formate lyase activating enzyme
MLSRYEEIAQGMPARHRILKTIGVGSDLADMGEDELWRLHDGKLPELRKLVRSCKKTSDLELQSPSLLDVKIALAGRIMGDCHFCGNRCGTDRFKRPGVCGVNAVSHVSSEFLHHGEEPELVPSHTIFFGGCPFDCVYCQNWTISARINGSAVDPGELCRRIERRYREGSRNVNFVGGDPTPHLHTILKVVRCTTLNIPMIWNSNMYLTPESLKLLEGTMDVFLADFRYGSDAHALRYSGARDYWAVTTRAFLEAQKQGELLVRQLVLPGHVECCTKPIVEWCAQNLGKDVRFNLMFQYRPEYKASEFPEIDRILTSAEIRRALEIVKEAGLTNLV